MDAADALPPTLQSAVLFSPWLSQSFVFEETASVYQEGTLEADLAVQHQSSAGLPPPEDRSSDWRGFLKPRETDMPDDGDVEHRTASPTASPTADRGTQPELELEALQVDDLIAGDGLLSPTPEAFAGTRHLDLPARRLLSSKKRKKEETPQLPPDVLETEVDILPGERVYVPKKTLAEEQAAMGWVDGELSVLLQPDGLNTTVEDVEDPFGMSALPQMLSFEGGPGTEDQFDASLQLNAEASERTPEDPPLSAPMPPPAFPPPPLRCVLWAALSRWCSMRVPTTAVLIRMLVRVWMDRQIPLGLPDDETTTDVFDASTHTLQLVPNHLPRHMYNFLRLALGLSNLAFEAVEPLEAATLSEAPAVTSIVRGFRFRPASNGRLTPTAGNLFLLSSAEAPSPLPEDPMSDLMGNLHTTVDRSTHKSRVKRREAMLAMDGPHKSLFEREEEEEPLEPTTASDPLLASNSRRKLSSTADNRAEVLEATEESKTRVGEEFGGALEPESALDGAVEADSVEATDMTPQAAAAPTFNGAAVVLQYTVSELSQATRDGLNFLFLLPVEELQASWLEEMQPTDIVTIVATTHALRTPTSSDILAAARVSSGDSAAQEPRVYLPGVTCMGKSAFHMTPRNGDPFLRWRLEALWGTPAADAMELDISMPLEAFVEQSDVGYWTDDTSMRQEHGLPSRSVPKVRTHPPPLTSGLGSVIPIVAYRRRQLSPMHGVRADRGREERAGRRGVQPGVSGDGPMHTAAGGQSPLKRSVAVAQRHAA